MPDEVCTTAPGKPASATAVRACSTPTGWLVENSSSRPPVNSTPRSRPRTTIPPIATSATAAVTPIQTPIRFIRNGPLSVSQVRSRPAPPSPDRRTVANGPAHRPVGEDAGDDQRREHRGHHADRQRHPEALDRAGGEEEQQPGREQGRHVGVEDRRPRLAVARVERRREPLAPPRGVLLPGALEDQHVGVDGQPDREHEAGQPGQRQRRAQPDQQAVGDQRVGRERDRRHQAHQPVDHHDEQPGQGDADDGGLDGRVDRGVAEGGADGALLDDLDGHRQGAALDQDREVVGAALGELAGDLGGGPGAGAELGLDGGGGDHLAVEQDRDALAAGGVAAGAVDELPPLRRARAVEGHRRRPTTRRRPGAARRGVAARRCRRGPGGPIRIGWPASSRHLRRAGGRLALLRRGTAHDVEAELCGPADHLGRLARVLHAGQLDDDPLLAGAGEGRLGDPERVDAAAQHLEGPVGRRAVRLHPRAVAGLQDDLRAALEIEPEPRGQGQRGQQGQADDGEGGDGAPERRAGRC